MYSSHPEKIKCLTLLAILFIKQSFEGKNDFKNLIKLDCDYVLVKTEETIIFCLFLVFPTLKYFTIK